MKPLASKNCRRLFLLFIFALFNWFYSPSVSAEEATTSVSDHDFLSPSLFPDNPRISSWGPLAALSSQNCTGTGDEFEGSLTCRQSYPNGDSLLLTTDYETFGNELKAQTRIARRDTSGLEKESKTIRHKIRYSYLGKQKVKEAEFFDIVLRPPSGRVTREIFLYEYYGGRQQLKTAVWTFYRRIGRSSLALLSYHASLAYDPQGKPLKANVNKYQEGVKVEELRAFDPPAWKQWEELVLKPLRERAFSPA